MKRNAFTLVELIFVIVIIGILAAVAIPKFTNLKQNAEVKAVIKTTTDTAASAASAAVNQLDLENVAATDLNLSTLVDVKGKGWSYSNAAGAGRYDYNSTTNANIAFIKFNATSRMVEYNITCANFTDTISQAKCKSDLNNTGGVDVNISF